MLCTLRVKFLIKFDCLKSCRLAGTGRSMGRYWTRFRRCTDKLGLLIGRMFSWLPTAPTDYATFLGLPLMLGFIFIDLFLMCKGIMEIVIGSLIAKSSGWDVTAGIDTALGVIQIIIALPGLPVSCTGYQKGIIFLGLGLRLVLINIIFEIIVDTFANAFRLAGVGAMEPWVPTTNDWLVLGATYGFNLLYIISSYWLIGTVNSLRAVYIAGGDGWERRSPSDIYAARISASPQIFLIPSDLKADEDEKQTRRTAMKKVLERSGLFVEGDTDAAPNLDTSAMLRTSAVTSMDQNLPQSPEHLRERVVPGDLP
eukprot:Gregarina_sp_Poly_1__2806@NODE_1780_length_3344_cov_71_803784_g1158_i0_p1_GENE_NODE_1780_length_3344_cov_71_803784_g1158_i0NODE_1780_length_3344_cov_71_803784_g1158_i0_p1_ORF_typecomplete_len312_score26_14_NODE_1780_length_3344_cov_71_803784_g1158_i017802715